MSKRRVDAVPTRRRDDRAAAMSPVACPPIGPGGRWADAAHVLFYATLGVATTMALVQPRPGAVRAALGAALVAGLTAWYSYWIVGRGREVVSSVSRRTAYFAGVALLWTPLLFLHPAYELLQLTIFAQVLGYLPWRSAIPAVALGFVLIHVPQVVWTGRLELVHVAYAAGGLGVFTLLVLSLRAITEQSHRRQQLIDALEATRQELARTERRAGVLEERQRLAGEIHDTLAQAFTSIVMLLEAGQGALRSGSREVAGHLEQSLRVARDGLGEARQFVWALRPESLERGSLPEALERATSQLTRQTGIAARTVVTGQPRQLPATLEITLLRAAQEALSNVRRHANARQVAVTLSYMEGVTVLDVCDDGVGFDPVAQPRPPGREGGFGLVTMRERVEMLKGSLSVESAPGRGCTLVVELPTGPSLVEAAIGNEAGPS
jgi:signal transduction histidine kinase